MAKARHVFRWDLDKTYLRSEFATFKDLIKSALESPNDKKSFPGASALLRALRQSAEPMTSARIAELFSIHPNVARHHLDKLTEEGFVQAARHHSGGRSGVGRPA